MALSIPCSVWPHTVPYFLPSIPKTLLLVSLVKQILYANLSMEKKKRHVLEGGTFGDQVTESTLWQKTQKH